jgi:hypothetical protein
MGALRCSSDPSEDAAAGDGGDAGDGLDGAPDIDGSNTADGSVNDGALADAGGDGTTVGPDGAVLPTLLSLWNGNGHFVEDQTPIPVPNPPGAGLTYDGHREVFPVPRPDLGAGIVYFYQRCFEGAKTHTCLGISHDDGKTITEDKGAVLKMEASSPCNAGAGELFLVATTVAKVGSEWTAVYEGGGYGSCWATSPDGIAWTKKGPLFPGETLHATPGIFVQNGTISVFTGKQINSTRLSIALHQGTTMTTLVDKGIVLQGTDPWEAATVSMPRVVFWDGYYWMTYEGSSLNYLCGETPPDPNQTQYGWGLARSSDLLTWQKFGGNPILQSVDRQSCGHDMPQPFLDPSTSQYYVYYPVDLAYEVHRDRLVFGSACNGTQTLPLWREKNHTCMKSCSGLGGATCLQRKSCSGDAGPDAGGRGTSWDCAICCN